MRTGKRVTGTLIDQGLTRTHHQAISVYSIDSMLQFEIDCDNGKGDAWACHSVGEFLAVVKVLNCLQNPIS